MGIHDTENFLRECDRALKIAVIMPLGEQRGGGELMLLHLMQQGRGRGVEWLVIFLEDGPMVAQVQAFGVETRLVKAGHLRQLPRFIASVGYIAAIARRERVDAILGWMGKAHLYGSLAAGMARIPALWYQLAVPSDKGWMDRVAVLLPGRGILTLCKAGEEAQKQLWPVRPTRLVYPGVELERFDPETLPSPRQARQQLGLPIEGPLIGIVGRLQKWKGIHTLIKAMPDILREHSDACCIVVGGQHALEPDYPNYLDALITDLNLRDRVIMAGLQSNVPLWMQAMDVIVHASDREPFGIVVLEAMALGKPVVAGNEGGPTEIITDGVDGLLTPFNNAPALARAVQIYLADEMRAKQMGAAARMWAQEFSTQRYAHNVVQAILSLLGKDENTSSGGYGSSLAENRNDPVRK